MKLFPWPDCVCSWLLPLLDVALISKSYKITVRKKQEDWSVNPEQ